MFSLFSRPLRCEPFDLNTTPQTHLPTHLRGPNPETLQRVPLAEGNDGHLLTAALSLGKTPGKSEAAEFDMANLYIVLAGVVLSSGLPKVLKVKTQQLKLAIVLGTWTLTSFALVSNLNEKFWAQEKDLRLKHKEEVLYRLRQEQLARETGLGETTEVGFGGQEGLRDQFATTRGDH